MFETAAYIFNYGGLPGVIPLAAQEVIEDPDSINQILLDIFPCRLLPVKAIQQFEVKSQAIAADDDIIVMEVTVIFPQQVNLFEPLHQSMEKVQRLESAQAPAGLAPDEFRQHQSVYIFGNENGNRLFAMQEFFLGMIVNDNGAVPQLV